MAGQNGSTHDRETILRDLVHILADMTSDWDTGYSGGILPGTRIIGDLQFESIDVVQLLVAIEEHFHRNDLPFVELIMQDSRYVDELQVGEIADFLAKHLNAK
jgi:acyl carrier protein